MQNHTRFWISKKGILSIRHLIMICYWNLIAYIYLTKYLFANFIVEKQGGSVDLTHECFTNQFISKLFWQYFLKCSKFAKNTSFHASYSYSFAVSSWTWYKHNEQEQIVWFMMFDDVKGIASQIILSKIKSWVKMQKWKAQDNFVLPNDFIALTAWVAPFNN